MRDPKNRQCTNIMYSSERGQDEQGTEARITKGSLDMRACSRGRLEETSGLRRPVTARSAKLHAPEEWP